MNSRRKGARGELAFAKELHALGWEGARRTAQRTGQQGGMPDIAGLPGLHLECKCGARPNIHRALEQAERDNERGGGEAVPVVLSRRDRESTIVSFRLADIHSFIHRALGALR